MAKIISLAVLTVLSLFAFCDAAPRSLDINDLRNLSAALEPEVPVRYDGAQLWSVEFNDDKTKRIVVDLKHKYGLFSSLFFLCYSKLKTKKKPITEIFHFCKIHKIRKKLMLFVWMIEPSDCAVNYIKQTKNY